MDNKTIKFDGSNQEALENWKSEYSKITEQEIKNLNIKDEDLFDDD